MDNAFYAVKARRLVGNDDTTEGQPGWPCWIIYRKDGTFIWGTYGHYDRLWDDAMAYLAFQGVNIDDEEAVEAWWDRHRFIPKFAGQVGVDVHSHWSAQYRHSWIIDYEKTELDDNNQCTNRHDVFLAPYDSHETDLNNFHDFTDVMLHNALTSRQLRVFDNARRAKTLNPRDAVYVCEKCDNAFRLGTRGPVPTRCRMCR